MKATKLEKLTDHPCVTERANNIFFRKIDISIETLHRSRKIRNQFTLNSTRIRFDVKKLAPVSETMVYFTSISNKSQIYLKPCFLHGHDKYTEMQTLR